MSIWHPQIFVLRRLILDTELSIDLATYVFIMAHILNTSVVLSEDIRLVFQHSFSSTNFVSTTAFLISSECCCLHCGCLAYMLLSPFPLEEFLLFVSFAFFAPRSFLLHNLFLAHHSLTHASTQFFSLLSSSFFGAVFLLIQYFVTTYKPFHFG